MCLCQYVDRLAVTSAHINNLHMIYVFVFVTTGGQYEQNTKQLWVGVVSICFDRQVGSCYRISKYCVHTEYVSMSS